MSNNLISFKKNILIGAPERIRTSDLGLRRAALYPAELRADRATVVITVYVRKGKIRS